MCIRSFLFKVICFSLLYSFSFSIGSAKPIVKKVVDEAETFDILKKYEFYDEKCDYFVDRLVVIKNIEYYGFDKQYHDDGEIVVLDAVANELISIFTELKREKFPIYNLKVNATRRIVTFGPFGIFGTRVIDDDNVLNMSGGYCCRVIEYTDRLSLHSFGTAIDINTLQNPCIFINEETNEVLKVVPEQGGVMYLNRSFNRKGKEEKDFGKIDDKIVKIFKKHGYDIWGGYWDTPIDYQHFQVSTRKFADLLIFANEQDAKKIFNNHIACINSKDKSLVEIANEKNFNLMEEYKANKVGFIKEIDSWCKSPNIKNIKKLGYAK